MTPSFFAWWLIFSFLMFTISMVVAGEWMNDNRGFNTWCVILSQTIGAVAAYAIHSF